MVRLLLISCVLAGTVTAWAQQQGSLPDNPSPQPPTNASPGSGNSSHDQSQNQSGSSNPGKGAANADASKKSPNLAPPRSDRVDADDLGDIGESSSKDTQIDLSPPPDDTKRHPNSSSALADAEAEASGVAEFHPWDPHKAAKDVEVGDFYFKRKNYRAAEDRYREALLYKDNDAVATFRLAQCLEKLDEPGSARDSYESYLKILPHGPFAEEAQKALDRLKKQGPGQKQARQ